MSMWLDRTKSTEHGVWAGPNFELSIHDEGEVSEGWKLAVVEPKASKELPDALNGIELRAVRGKEKQREVGLLREAPGGMKRGVVVFGVVDDDDHAPAGACAEASQMAQERPAGSGIEVAGRWQRAEFAVAHSDRSEVADALSRWRMDADRIPNFRRNPHTTAAAVLLEVNFIQRPQIDGGIGWQQPEFFYRRLRRWIRLTDFRSRCAQAKPQSPKEPLALAHPQGHAKLLFQERGQQRAIPELRPRGATAFARRRRTGRRMTERNQGRQGKMSRESAPGR